MDDSTELILVHELTDGMFDVDVDAAVTSDIAANTHCYLSGDGTIKPIGAAETQANVKKYLGYTVKPWKYGYDGKLGLQTRYRNLVKFTAGGTIAAGQDVRFEYGVGAITGQVVVWDSATDLPEERIGRCVIGGDDTETVQVLTY